MRLLLYLAAAVASWRGCEGHIHSQKVRSFEREALTPSVWLYALVSAALVGVCGVFPLLVNKWIRLDRRYALS